MNDKEIIKALECCTGHHRGCNTCAYYGGERPCTQRLEADALDLIKRQQAEIEKLKEVEHGHWVKCGYKWQCTHCQSLINIDGTPEENLLNHCPNCGAKMEMYGNPEEVKCKDCKHLMYSDCYGECSQGYKGIVQPDDSCKYGERKLK